MNFHNNLCSGIESSALWQEQDSSKLMGREFDRHADRMCAIKTALTLKTARLCDEVIVLKLKTKGTPRKAQNFIEMVNSYKWTCVRIVSNRRLALHNHSEEQKYSHPELTDTVQLFLEDHKGPLRVCNS
jgi:hypothetical protein